MKVKFNSPVLLLYDCDSEALANKTNVAWVWYVIAQLGTHELVVENMAVLLVFDSDRIHHLRKLIYMYSPAPTL